jgi:aspartyl/asparaginyl-tRNA synthetase
MDIDHLTNKLNLFSIEDPEVCFAKLKDHIDLRNKMMGAMYYEITQDECHAIAVRCYQLGYDKTKLLKFCEENKLEYVPYLIA